MNLLGKGNDSEFWSKTVREKECFKFYRDAQLENWKRLCENDTMEALKYTEFRLYALTGDRSVFQKPYYKRRVQVETAAILSLIYPEEQKYLDYLQDMIFIICNEYTWTIPAHQPKLMEVNNRRHLDLFSCETAYTLATIDTLLGDRLDQLIRERIRAEIDYRVINSFIDRTGWGIEKNTANWAAVCGGSIGCTVMLLRPERFEEVRPRLEVMMENYLSGFKDDGFCGEGTHYWHYGFGFFCSYAQMLRIFTEGKTDYFKRPKIHKIATFIQKVYLSGKTSVSFSDAGSTTLYQIGLLHFLKNEYDDVKVFSPEYSYINDDCGRFCWLVSAATWFDEDIYYNPTPNNESAEYYGENTGWLIKRTEAYGFVAKAGHNNEQHNHNDVGSFIIAKNEKHIITDPGAGKYSQQYFNAATRYGMIECSSLGHSVPYFGDVIQKFGAQYTSSDVKFENGVFSMDIAGAYGDDSVKSIKRSFSFGEKEIFMNDSFVYTGEAPITERLISFVKPEVCDNKVKFEDLTIEFNKELCKTSISSATTSKNTEIFLIDFELKKDVFDFSLKFS